MHWQQAAPLLALAGFAWGDEITTATDTLPTGQQGWAPSSSFWSPVTCDDPSQTYVMSSTYGRCCANSHLNCGFATSCISTSSDIKILYGSDGGSSLCTSGETCAFMTIYDYATTDTPAIDIFCANGWPETASTIFRTTAAETTTSDSKASATATPGSSPTSSIAAATTTASSSTGEAKKESKTWIAGAVIGPVAGCALIGALGFWLTRRMRNKGANYHQDEAQDNSLAHLSQNQGFSELESSSPQELPAYDKSVPSELPSSNPK